MDEQVIGGGKRGENEEEDDEFFGSQDDDGDGFGALGERETVARQQELQTLGYVEAYDETKDSLLQQGFEAGYRETHNAALRLGNLLGRIAAEEHLLGSQSDGDKAEKKQAEEASRQVYEFLTTFQTRDDKSPVNAKESIELLAETLQKSISKDDTDG